MKRRDFLLRTGGVCAGIALVPTLSCSRSKENKTFVLPKLGFAFDALEPNIDARTMEIHYTKHHAGYVKKLNAALEKHPLRGEIIVDICRKVTGKVADVAVLNNGGGHYNHSLFWEILQPNGAKAPAGKLAKQIDKDFGSFENFTKEFAQAAATVFGSGWAWLVVDAKGKLFVTSTQNQENPLMKNVVSKVGLPILGIDVWEHAYYLHYQNRRKEYIANFMNLINWDVVAAKFLNAIAQH